MNERKPGLARSKDIETWKTLKFRPIGCSFESLKRHLHERSISFYGPTGNVRPKGPVSPKGEVHLALISPTEDLGFGENEQYSYLDMLEQAMRLGLRPGRPSLAPQLLFEDGAEYPPDFEAFIASHPKELRRREEKSCFSVFVFGTKTNRDRYLQVSPMTVEPIELTNFTDQLWIFEVD